MMDEFHKHYAALYNGVTDALEDLKQLNYGQAEARLRRLKEEVDKTYLAAARAQVEEALSYGDDDDPA